MQHPMSLTPVFPLRRACVTAATLALLIVTRPSRGHAAGQVHPYWRDAYIFSFRSPDLLTDDPDERWGRADARLVSGGILSDLPRWLRCHAPLVREARRQGRPVLLSLHLHSGWGTGLVTYTE